MRYLLVIAVLFYSNMAHAIPPESFWVYDVNAKKESIASNQLVVRPIASITKLMTAMVALDHFKDLKEKIKIKNGSKLPPDHYTIEDLLTAMLVRSDNIAAETIAENFPGGREAFLRAMNHKAYFSKLTNTKFIDPSGLSVHNVSTAEEVGKMVLMASNYDFIKNTSTKKQASFEVLQKKKAKVLILENTNRKLLFEFASIILSKTGFTNPAGFCLALAVEQDHKKYIIVILGTKSPKQRIDLAEKLIYNHVKD
jgi:D-alanyl-D-alanine endopeptidase (penicillin-binding protein 7)